MVLIGLSRLCGISFANFDIYFQVVKIFYRSYRGGLVRTRFSVRPIGQDDQPVLLTPGGYSFFAIIRRISHSEKIPNIAVVRCFICLRLMILRIVKNRCSKRRGAVSAQFGIIKIWVTILFFPRRQPISLSLLWCPFSYLRRFQDHP